MMAPRYEYGMGRPQSMGRPGTIDDFMRQRQQYEMGQQALYERQQQQAMDYRYKTAMQDREEAQQMRLSRLGLAPLDTMLTDPSSAAYQNTYSTGAEDRDGNPIYQTPEQMGIDPVRVDIAPVGEGPMPALGLSPLHGVPMRREVRPDFREAQAALRPDNAVSSNRMTTQEYIERLKAKQVADSETDDRRTQNDMMLKLTDAELESIMVAANIKAKDLAADKPGVAEELQKAVTAYVQSKGGTQKLDMGGGAADGTQAKPSATEANGELKVEVAPAGAQSAKDIEEAKDETGAVYRRPDGTKYFVNAKTGKVREIGGR